MIATRGRGRRPLGPRARATLNGGVTDATQLLKVALASMADMIQGDASVKQTVAVARSVDAIVRVAIHADDVNAVLGSPPTPPRTELGDATGE